MPRRLDLLPDLAVDHGMRISWAITSVLALVAGTAHLGVKPLLRDPYLGLACGNASVFPCERVGLAVWLKQPARRVTAQVDGHRVILGTKAGGRGVYRRGVFWQGFFRDRRAQALADAARSIPVHVRVTTRLGEVVPVTTLVYVSEGYG